MPVVIRDTESLVDDATAAAIEEIQAALNAPTAEDAVTQATPPGRAAAGASGPAVGHGTIRLRVRAPDSEAEHAPATAPVAATIRGLVGHGAIRLRGRSAPAEVD